MKPTTQEEKENWSEQLSPEDHYRYRKVVGMLRFVVSERPDLLFVVFLLSRDLNAPTGESWARLRRCGRYLRGTTDLWLMMVPDSNQGPARLVAYADSDYAGDRATRRSVSCAWVELDGVPLTAYARQQSIVATSSSEAEYYAMSGATVQLLGASSMLHELGVQHVAILRSDSSSGRSLAQRRGLGRNKHVEVKHLWLQEVIAGGRVQLGPVRSQENPADIGTKLVQGPRLRELLPLVKLTTPGVDD